MNAKKKIAKSLFSMVSMVLVVVVALIFIFSIQDAKSKQLASAYTAYGVAASVAGSYFVGSESFKMLSGDSDVIVFGAAQEESCPALDPAGEIKLSSRNNFVVFEYRFTNNSDTVSFVASVTSVAEAENMDITYGFSYDKLRDYDDVNKKTINSVPVISGSGNNLYYYVKIKISDLNKASSLKGTFCFSLTAEEVYNLYLIDGVFKNKTYVALGYEINDVEVPQKEGFQFEGYYTLPAGMGEQVFDENGHSGKIWTKEKGATLFAHYTKIVEDKAE